MLSLLPETELYLCRICEPNSPRLWLGTAERVLQDRLRCIMNSLLEVSPTAFSLRQCILSREQGP